MAWTGDDRCVSSGRSFRSQDQNMRGPCGCYSSEQGIAQVIHIQLAASAAHRAVV